MINKRRLYEIFLMSNIHRLSDKTLEKIVCEVEDEVEKSIDEELEEGETGSHKVHRMKALDHFRE